MKWYRAFSFLFTSVATGLAAAFLVLLLRPDLVGWDTDTPTQPPTIVERSNGPVSYANAVQRAAPAVVNVYATKIMREKPHPLHGLPLPDAPAGGNPHEGHFGVPFSTPAPCPGAGCLRRDQGLLWKRQSTP